MEETLLGSSDSQDGLEDALLGETISLDDIIDNISLQEDKKAAVITQNRNDAGWTSWKMPEFWLLFTSFSCVAGCGLMVINNVSTIFQSMGGTDSYAGTLVFMLSISNVSGRILAGLLGDASSKWFPASITMRRILLLQGVNVIMALAMILGYPGGQRIICLTLLIVMGLDCGAGLQFVWKRSFRQELWTPSTWPGTFGDDFQQGECQKWYQQHTYNNACLGREFYGSSYLSAGLVGMVGNFVTIVSCRIPLRKENQ